MINGAGKHLLTVVSDILDVSKLEAGRLVVNKQAFDVVECIHEVAEIWRAAAESKSLDYEVDIPSTLYTCASDERLIRQVVSNLISNAVKFTTEGTVRISLRLPADGGFAIEVADTGIGIPADKQKEVFEPFKQADGRLQRN